jgi:hypothetical protein
MPEIPLTEQTLYAELVDRCSAAAFEAEFPLNGSFVKVTVKERTYWYFQQGNRDASGRQPRKYVGPDTPENRERIKNHGRAKNDYRERRHIIATLRRLGFQSPPEEIGRIIEALSAAGVFRMRTCLIGTTAYQLYGPLLGIRLPHASVQTGDLDIAQFTSISIAIAEDERTPPLIEILRQADPSFRPVPHSQVAEATATYINDHGYRVEVLTENRGPESEKPATLPAIGTDAQPLRFLDYLIYEELPAVVLYNAGVLVNVPPPSRYALHKIIIAQRRRAGSAKVNKDLHQAEALLDALVARRPSELHDAWREALARGPTWRRLLTTGLGMISAKIRDRALHVFGATRSILPNHDLQFFDAPPRYDFSRDVVLFDGEAGRERVICAISREALDDHFGADGLGKQQRLELFRHNRKDIQETARIIYLNKPVPADGSVLITTADMSETGRHGQPGSASVRPAPTI